jgi:hypothetical protein
MKSAIFSSSKKSMEILFNVQPTLPSKNKIVPDLSEHDCTLAVQKNRVHFKNQAIKFSSILCFVNVGFDIIQGVSAKTFEPIKNNSVIFQRIFVKFKM